MKAKYFVLLVLILNINTLFGQGEPDEKMDKFKSQKIAFITEKLQLTPTEAQAFWPVYNEFSNKRQAIQEEKIKAGKDFMQKEDNVSEKEASEIADNLINLQMREAQLVQEYNGKFKAILPATKVVKLYLAEVQFRRTLLRQFKEEHERHGRGEHD